MVVFCEARVTKVSSAAEHFPGLYDTRFLSSSLVIWVWEYYWLARYWEQDHLHLTLLGHKACPDLDFLIFNVVIVASSLGIRVRVPAIFFKEMALYQHITVC